MLKGDRPLLLALFCIALSLLFNAMVARFGVSDFWRRTVDEPINLFTAVLATFTIVLAFASIWQGRLTNRSIDIALDEFRATHRPEIVVHAVSLPMDFSEHDSDDMRIGAFILYFNKGTATAKITNVTAEITRRRPPLQSGAVIHEKARFRNETLEGGMKDYIRAKSENMLNFEKTIQRTGDLAHGRIYCMGVISYEDERGIKRETGFCRRFNALSEHWVEADEPEYEYSY